MSSGNSRSSRASTRPASRRDPPSERDPGGGAQDGVRPESRAQAASRQPQRGTGQVRHPAAARKETTQESRVLTGRRRDSSLRRAFRIAGDPSGGFRPAGNAVLPLPDGALETGRMVLPLLRALRRQGAPSSRSKTPRQRRERRLPSFRRAVMRRESRLPGQKRSVRRGSAILPFLMRRFEEGGWPSLLPMGGSQGESAPFPVQNRPSGERMRRFVFRRHEVGKLLGIVYFADRHFSRKQRSRLHVHQEWHLSLFFGSSVAPGDVGAEAEEV
jgi:hypothetical protein